MKQNQRKYFFSILALAMLLTTSFVLADHIVETSDGTTSYSINEDVEFLFNITVNNTDLLEDANITQVNITLPESFAFTIDSNYTDAGVHLFENTSTVLSWSNDGLVMNLTSQNFWFNATPSTPGEYNLTITTTNLTGPSIETNISITVNDTTAPIVTLPVYVNGTKKTNLENLTLNISVTDPDSSISACLVHVNGVNQTIAYDSGWCNTTSISLTGLVDGNHTIFAYANNTFNVFGLNDSYVVEINDSLYRPAAVSLGLAGDFTILAKTGISTAAVPTLIIGDIGVSPSAATTITGFSLALDSTECFSKASLANGNVTGKVYAADYDTLDCTTPAYLSTAVTNMQTAYTNANVLPSNAFINLGAGNLGGMTLVSGYYDFPAGVTIPSELTLYGDADDVWIFSIDGTLDISSATDVVLSGGAKATNVFWAVADTVTIGTTANFKGNILGQTDIIINTGANLTGRALAQTAVTADANTITIADAIVPSPPGITLPLYLNGTVKSNSSTLTLNIYVTDSGTGRDYCAINVNGTNQTIPVVAGWCNTTSIALTGLVDENYTINVYANDTLGAFSLNDSYIVQMDSTIPTVTLIAPANATSSTTDSYNFTFNATDNHGFASCNLILNDVITDTNNDIITNDTNGIYKTSIDAGTYTWSINCTDLAGNIANSTTRTLIIEEEATPSSGSSGSPGYPMYKPSEEEVSQGYQKTIRKNFRIEFQFAGESHMLTVDEITRTSATITITSEPQEATLQVGEIRKFDLNGDNYYDLLVRLDSIDYSNTLYPTATFTIQTISEMIEQPTSTEQGTPTTTQPQETGEEGYQPGITGQIIGEGTTGYTWVILVVIAIIIGFAIYYLAKSKKKRKYVHHRQNKFLS